MTYEPLQVHARVTANGQLELTEPLTLPVGDEVLITIEPIEPVEEELTPEMIAAEDAIWDEFFIDHPEILTTLADQARQEIAAGTTIDFDPDVDEI